jgi:hypothetical protein
MTPGERDDLVTDEGVDEGSAASTAEDAGSGASGTSGSPTRGGPATEQDPAGPLDVETGDVTAARRVAPGQELAEGEG